MKDNSERIENAKTLPYWVQDNRKTVSDIINSKAAEREENRHATNRREYERLLTDINYKDVAFDGASGGVKATHVRHNFDKIGGEYEKRVQDIGYKNGHSVILGSEYSDVIGERFTEGLWDGLYFEIATRETGTENNVLRGLKHCADKRRTEIALLYFPNGQFDVEILKKSISRYKGYKQFPERTYVEFKRVICIDEKGDIVYDKPL